MTPAPGWAHQSVQARLLTQLYAACPRDLRVLGAPFEVRFTDNTALQPDILVARYTDIDPKRLQSRRCSPSRCARPARRWST